MGEPARSAARSAFETWLQDIFNVFGLEAHEPFRIRREQIDGGFVLQGEPRMLY